jgi:glycosyltransferase involved in cell wall biosynthesis
LRVLFVTSSFPRWSGDGTTRFVLHLAQDLREIGWDIHVLAPHAASAPVREVFEGVPVERFRYMWPESKETVCYQGGALMNLRANRWNLTKVPFLLASELTAVVRRLSTNHFDLVHSHWLVPQGLLCGVASRVAGVPHVATIHGSDVFALGGRVVTPFKRVALGLADAITANSSATFAAAVALSANRDRLVRIPMGAATREPTSNGAARWRAMYRRAGGPLLVFVGRLIEQKGVDDVLKAVALLTPRVPGVSAVIVGDGPLRTDLEALAASLRITDRVSFVGWVEPSDVSECLAAADAFVATPKRGKNGEVEGQGLTFVEAMLAGTPVIATANGGIVDVVRHEDTGLVVREGCPEDIAEAVTRIIQDPALVERLRAGGRAVANREFTREASARAFADLYTRVLSSHDVRRGQGLPSKP